MSDKNANESAPNNANDNTNEDDNDDASIGISTSTRRAYKYDDPPIVFKDVDVNDFNIYLIIEYLFLFYFFSRVLLH